MGRLTRALLTGIGLLLCNLVVLGASPHPETRSGNGFHPQQLLGFVISAALTIVWLRVMAGAGRDLSVRLNHPSRRGLSSIALLAAGGLFFWFIQGWSHFTTTTFYYKMSGSAHNWGRFNQYTIGYWASAWQFWASVALMGIAWGTWWGKRESNGDSPII